MPHSVFETSLREFVPFITLVTCYVTSLVSALDYQDGVNHRTLYMDMTDDCGDILHNDDMSEGDYYTVASDSFEGKSHWTKQRPAECINGFNFGDRLAAIVVRELRCDIEFNEPFLSVYDNCHGQRKNMLAYYNCSSMLPSIPINSPSACVTIYHYRGHTMFGYYFRLLIVARHEIMPFPAGGVAAIIISSLVVLMLIVKLICVISGYERRLPEITFDADEHKEILVQTAVEAGHTDPVIHVHAAAGTTCRREAREDMPDGGVVGTSRTGAARSLAVPTWSEHAALAVTRSLGSGSHGSGAEVSSDLDYDFLEVHIDNPATPRLKRYPSAKASSLWRH